MFIPLNVQNTVGLVISAFQFSFSVIMVLYLSTVPLGRLFPKPKANDRRFLPQRLFVTDFYSLAEGDRVASYGLWFAIFVSKFIESYFF